MIYYCIYCGVLLGENVVIVYMIGVLLGENVVIVCITMSVYCCGVMVGENVVIVGVVLGDD